MRTHGWLRLAAVALGLAGTAAGAALVVAVLDGALRVAEASRLPLAVYAASNAALALFCLLIAWRAGRAAGALMLGIALAAVGAANTAPLALMLLNLGAYADANVLVFAFAGVATIRSVQIFPRRLRAEDLRGLEAGSGVARRWVLRATAWVLDPPRLWLILGGGLAVGALASMSMIEPLGSVLHTSLNLGILLLITLTVRYNYLSAEREEARRKIFWLSLAPVLMLGMMALRIAIAALVALEGATVPEHVGAWFGAATILSAAVGVGLAIFYAGAVDPRLVIQRTAVYSTSLALLVFAFAVVQNVVAGAFADRMGLDGRMVSAIAGAAVGMAFQPLQAGLTRLWKGRVSTSVPRRART